MQFDDKLQVQPQLASSYSLSSDGLTWTFKLKPNLKFSDGTPLTSADVVYSINRALLPATKSTVGPIYLALIKDSDKLNAGKITTIIGDSLLTPDPNTVVIIANKKAAYFLDALVYSTSYVVEKSLIDKYGANFTDHLNEGGGDGPFKVQTYTHGTNIVLVPNPNYYGAKPQLTKLIYPFYKQVDTNYKAYEAGQTDYSTCSFRRPRISEGAAEQPVFAGAAVVDQLLHDELPGEAVRQHPHSPGVRPRR